MRIRVLGTCDSAIAVRGMLNTDPSVVVSDDGYLYTVEIATTDYPYPTVDGVDSEWERKLIERISKCANTNIMLLRVEGVQSDQHIKIGVPNDSNHPLIERGILQAILQMVAQKPVVNGPIAPDMSAVNAAEARAAAANEAADKAEIRAELARAETAREMARLQSLKSEPESYKQWTPPDPPSRPWWKFW